MDPAVYAGTCVCVGVGIEKVVFRELAHVIVRVGLGGKSQVCRTHRLETQVGVPSVVLKQNFFSKKP